MQTIANITTTLKAAGLGLSNVVWAQGYATNVAEAPRLQATLARAVDSPRGLVAVPRLPGPIRAELTFVATKGPGSAVYVDAVTAAGADVESEVRQAFARLGQSLKKGGAGWGDVALVTVYLTDVADLARMNTVFKETFPHDPPARVTIQVHAQAKERIRIGLIAAR